MQTVIVKDTRVTKAIHGMRLQCGISASTKAQLTNSSYGVDVMGMFLRGMLLFIVANFSLYDRECDAVRL